MEALHHPHLFLEGGLGFAAGEELLVEEVHHRHVVVDAQVVEKRFSHLQREFHLLLRGLAALGLSKIKITDQSI